MRTYRELKEENELFKEVIERQKKTLEAILKQTHKNNSEIAKQNIELRYLRRKVSEYQNKFKKEINI